jgi:hypothetical protein
MEQPTSKDFLFLGKLKKKFTDMNFFAKADLALGGNKNGWVMLVYILSSLGFFCRQITQFPKVKLNIANIQWDVFVASMIFGLAVLPFFIKQVNKVIEEPGLQQILSAFGVGFFMDFTTNAIINFYFK